MVQGIVVPMVSVMPDTAYPLADRLAALAFLGQSHWLDLQALCAQTALIEWSRMHREWQFSPPDFPGSEMLPYGPIRNFTDVAILWAMWAVRGQRSAAQGLLAHCALPYLDLPIASGRRHGAYDPGRRRQAVVINFPDRRRPEPVP